MHAIKLSVCLVIAISFTPIAARTADIADCYSLDEFYDMVDQGARAPCDLDVSIALKNLDWSTVSPGYSKPELQHINQHYPWLLYIRAVAVAYEPDSRQKNPSQQLWYSTILYDARMSSEGWSIDPERRYFHRAFMELAKLRTVNPRWETEWRTIAGKFLDSFSGDVPLTGSTVVRALQCFAWIDIPTASAPQVLSSLRTDRCIETAKSNVGPCRSYLEYLGIDLSSFEGAIVEQCSTYEERLLGYSNIEEYLADNLRDNAEGNFRIFFLTSVDRNARGFEFPAYVNSREVLARSRRYFGRARDIERLNFYSVMYQHWSSILSGSQPTSNSRFFDDRRRRQMIKKLAFADDNVATQKILECAILLDAETTAIGTLLESPRYQLCLMTSESLPDLILKKQGVRN